MIPEEIYATFAGPIDNLAANRFFANANVAVNGGAKRVHLLIQSSGGFVGDGIAISNYLKNLPMEIITYNAGHVSSIAVIVFLAGKVRKASANATFMIHKASITLQVPATAEMLRVRVDSLSLDDGHVEAILHKHIQMPADKWLLHERGDLHLDAVVSKEYGLIHEISDFKVPSGAQIFNI